MVPLGSLLIRDPGQAAKGEGKLMTHLIRGLAAFGATFLVAGAAAFGVANGGNPTVATMVVAAVIGLAVTIVSHVGDV
jgi:hypothetical protein